MSHIFFQIHHSFHSYLHSDSREESDNDIPLQFGVKNSPELCQYPSFQQNLSAHMELNKKFLDNQIGHVCDICDRLWFKNDLKLILNNDATCSIYFIRTVLTNDSKPEVKICSTCFKTIKINNVPPLSVYNGFKYPPLSETLKNLPLDLVTERLISPRIPFMQIRKLRHVVG